MVITFKPPLTPASFERSTDSLSQIALSKMILLASKLGPSDELQRHKNSSNGTTKEEQTIKWEHFVIKLNVYIRKLMLRPWNERWLFMGSVRYLRDAFLNEALMGCKDKAFMWYATLPLANVIGLVNYGSERHELLIRAIFWVS